MQEDFENIGINVKIEDVELDFEGTKVKIKTFEKDAEVGDFAQVSIGTRKNVYGAELAVVVDKIIPANEIEDNWK